MYNILIFFLFIIHPIYISTSEIILNNNNAEVKIRIFRDDLEDGLRFCLLYTSPSPRDKRQSRMPSSA